MDRFDRDFLQEFRDACNKIDKSELEVSSESFKDTNELRKEAKKKQKLYNIHKRSLPVGIDKIVFICVTKAEGELLMSKFLKARAYQNDPQDSKTVIYWDMIPVDATPIERSVYYNPKPNVIEE